MNKKIAEGLYRIVDYIENNQRNATEENLVYIKDEILDIILTNTDTTEVNL